MTTYAIDDAHSQLITTGLAEHDARKVAQRIADRRGESVWLYEETVGACEAEEIAPTVYQPIDPTTEELAAVRAGAYNDLTRRIEQRGIRLSHDEADALGVVGCDWLVRRLGLHLVTDDRGTMFLPRGNEAES